eukprot:jgi/Ulvmu1/1905/UM012_0064.1
MMVLTAEREMSSKRESARLSRGAYAEPKEDEFSGNTSDGTEDSHDTNRTRDDTCFICGLGVNGGEEEEVPCTYSKNTFQCTHMAHASCAEHSITDWTGSSGWSCPVCSVYEDIERIEKILSVRYAAEAPEGSSAGAAAGAAEPGTAADPAAASASGADAAGGSSSAAAVAAGGSSSAAAAAAGGSSSAAAAAGGSSSAAAAAGGSSSAAAGGPAAGAGSSSAAGGGSTAEAGGSSTAAASLRAPPHAAQQALEFRVKLSDMAYVHAQWVPEAMLVAATKFMPPIKTKYRNFLQRVKLTGGVEALAEADESNGLEHGVSPDWTVAERIIAFDESDGTALVKWKGLDYDECTWEEPEDIAALELGGLVDDFKALLSAEAAAEELRTATKAAKRAGGSRGDARTFTETPVCLRGGELHSYQLDGLNWMLLRHRRQQNMILADEMGLGKTVQTIAMIASLREQGTPEPHLIVVPLSTLPNWERELAKWAPQVYVVVIKGNASARATAKKYDCFMPDSDASGRKRARPAGRRFSVMLATYETVIQEISFVKSFAWCTVTVDEGHRLKNARSRLYAALDQLRTSSRVLLTGTPLQNNLAELFYLMHFIEPGKFPDLLAFQTEYADLSTDSQVKKLHSMLADHLLRRVKKDVLTQLPPKREQLVRVELSEQQRAFYKQILVKQFPALAGGSSTGAGALKNVMMELRKCCNHPLLFAEEGELAAAAAATTEELVRASGKLELLDRMMPHFKEQGNRLLIYSQFTRTLDILQVWLAKRGWAFERLDGSIKSSERQARIDRFNSAAPDSSWVFLLSTRAGGVGINLATADTVVIFDSDWNPHNDIQAQARAHRLGQLKPVFTFRFVTRGTVEERIMQRTKEKRALETVVIGRQDLRQQDLDDILRHGAEELFADEVGDEAAHEAATRKRITYDEPALAALLDREARLKEAEADDDGGGGFMDDFKVANFELTEEEAAALESEQSEAKAAAEAAASQRSRAAGAKFWDSLLKAQHTQHAEAAAEELEQLGRGRRSRRAINYAEDGEPARVGDVGAGSSKAAAAGGRKRGRDDEYQPDEEEEDDDADAAEAGFDPLMPRLPDKTRVSAPKREANGTERVLYRGVPGDASFTVCGLDAAQRGDFLQAVLRVGLPLGEDGLMDFGALAMHARRMSNVLDASHDAALRSYGGVFLEFLEAAAPMRGRAVTLPHASKAVDRSVLLNDFSPDTIMKIAAAMHFVRLKLARHSAGLLKPPGPAKTSGKTDRDERFLIHGGANADPAWLRKFGSSSGDHSQWTTDDDVNLMVTVLELGLDMWMKVRESVSAAVRLHMRAALDFPQDYDSVSAVAGGENAPAPPPSPPAGGAAVADSTATAAAAATGASSAGGAGQARPGQAGGGDAAAGGASGDGQAAAVQAARSEADGAPHADAAAAASMAAAASAAGGPADSGRGAGAEAAPNREGAAEAGAAASAAAVGGSGAASGQVAQNGETKPAGVGAAAGDAAAGRDCGAAAAASVPASPAPAAAAACAGPTQQAASTVAAQQPACSTLSAAEVAGLRQQEARFLRQRFEYLLGLVVDETCMLEPMKVPYAAGYSVPWPLVRGPLGQAQLAPFVRLVNELNQRCLMVQGQTKDPKNPASSGRPTDPAQHFRSLVQVYNLKLRELHRTTLKLLAQYHRNGVHDISPDFNVLPISKSFQIDSSSSARQSFPLPTSETLSRAHAPASAAAAQRGQQMVMRRQHGAAAATQHAQQAKQMYVQQPQLSHAQLLAQAMQNAGMRPAAQPQQAQHARPPHIRPPPQAPRAVFTPPRTSAVVGTHAQVSMANIAAAAASAAASYQEPYAAAGVRPAGPATQQMAATQQQKHAAQQAVMVRFGATCMSAVPHVNHMTPCYDTQDPCMSRQMHSRFHRSRIAHDAHRRRIAVQRTLFMQAANLAMRPQAQHVAGLVAPHMAAGRPHAAAASGAAAAEQWRARQAHAAHAAQAAAANSRTPPTMSPTGGPPALGRTKPVITIDD